MQTPEQQQDADRLLVLALAGDDDARGALLETYRHYLELLARIEIGRRLQNKLDTADLVQETFLVDSAVWTRNCHIPVGIGAWSTRRNRVDFAFVSINAVVQI